ncbi:alkyl hydroperoxide reductase/ Thiol specific antioxidant/ Mal allergen [Haliangium ochraceum DSM 14365]|uniref:Alkyl hydroperoxide reductase/ Thiol specific antioxidant/ Mal allergen n=1 Tax=Haliangium ochraceum (strain DSM 14365 / JCM 11303 / SMP-2) TaxID=502025 RepID=D0LMP8_HALO1|nr:alkyl hydroperoxide reductase/ Thiol specific antioxidant/ Mal allergen [Haliangium ochraceum DSM 14365]
MRRGLRALLMIALLASLGACGGAQSGASSSGPPDFALRDLDGRTVRLSDYSGKVVLLNFWATWCVPCSAELPHLQRLYEAYAPDLVILAISMDGPETVAKVGPQARRYGLSFPVLLDEETRVAGMYNPKRAAPFTVVIAADGRIASKRQGYSAGDEIALEAELKSLLTARAAK